MAMNNPVSLLSLSWSQFEQYIKGQNGRILNNAKYSPLPVISQGRWSYLDELSACLTHFAQYPKFATMPMAARQQVAGTLPPNTERWFGWMGAAGCFMSLVNNNPHILAQWLDPVPAQGPVTVSQIYQYIVGMITLPGVALATATRLLATKRPDYCLPITSTNYANLRLSPKIGPMCPSLNIKKKTDTQEIGRIATRYGDMLSMIWATPWWASPMPTTRGWGQDLWQGRVAMLDAIFYAP